MHNTTSFRCYYSGGCCCRHCLTNWRCSCSCYQPLTATVDAARRHRYFARRLRSRIGFNALRSTRRVAFRGAKTPALSDTMRPEGDRCVANSKSTRIRFSNLGNLLRPTDGDSWSLIIVAFVRQSHPVESSVRPSHPVEPSVRLSAVCASVRHSRQYTSVRSSRRYSRTSVTSASSSVHPSCQYVRPSVSSSVPSVRPFPSVSPSIPSVRSPVRPSVLLARLSVCLSVRPSRRYVHPSCWRVRPSVCLSVRPSGQYTAVISIVRQSI